jgi:hypothetical protein
LWTPAAEQELAAIWMEAADRDTITSAANTIDDLLKADPQLRGESRQGDVRILFALPLGVDFEVSEPDRTVYVLSVWSVRKRGG